MSNYFSLSVLQLLQGYKKLLFASVCFTSLQISTIALHNTFPNTLALYIPKRDGINTKKNPLFLLCWGKKKKKGIYERLVYLTQHDQNNST